MPIPRVTLDIYATRYEMVKIERRNGILQMTMQINNRKVIWNTVAHEEMSNAPRMAGLDPDNQVIIITSTGEAFIDEDRSEIRSFSARSVPMNSVCEPDRGVDLGPSHGRQRNLLEARIRA